MISKNETPTYFEASALRHRLSEAHHEKFKWVRKLWAFNDSISVLMSSMVFMKKNSFPLPYKFLSNDISLEMTLDKKNLL